MTGGLRAANFRRAASAAHPPSHPSPPSRPEPSGRPSHIAMTRPVRVPRVAGGPPAAPDFHAIRRFARAADLAYRPDAEIVAAHPGLEVEVRDLPSVAGRVFVVTDPASGTQLVSARGTANLHDALLDCEYAKGADREADVVLHRGFERSAAVAWDAVEPLLKPGHTVDVTGHSLGGAIAAILMMYVETEGHDLGRVVTFGQPKVTNHAGVERYANAPLLRVVDARDPVPLVPPLTLCSALHGPYRHFGPEVILLDGSDYVLLPEHDAERFSVGSLWEALPHGVRIGDHHMGAYLARIEPKLSDAVAVPYGERARHEAPVEPAAE